MRGTRCGIHRIVQSLPESERAAVLARIEDIRQERERIGSLGSTPLTAKWLAQVLTDNGHPVSQMVMQNHVRRACSCGY